MRLLTPPALALLLPLLLVSLAAAAPAPAPAAVEGVAMSPEALGAQAFLEELLVRRFSQELSTRVDRAAFSVGAQLELVEAPKPDAPRPEDTIPDDLTVGSLDPERMLKDYADSDAGLRYQGLLGSYRVKSATFSVGLRDDLAPEAKAQVEEWLKARLESEFRSAGKGSVYAIKTRAEKPPVRSPVDWLETFQGLAGQALLAFAILLGTLLWKLIASKEGKGAPREAAAPIQLVPGAPAASEHSTSEQKITREASVQAVATREIRQLSRQLNELMPRVTDQYEGIIRSWCKGGDEGKVKLACFAEAVGKEVGKLPIPADSLQEVAKTFSKMPEVGTTEKRDSLRKVYWDLLMSLNLGSEALEQPFNYLGGLRLGMVNQMLLDQNPRMKALVAFHMPVALRDSYLRAMDTEQKIAMIRAAGEMNEMPVDELRSVDTLFKGRAQGGGGNRDVVPLSLALPRLLSALSPVEEVTLLSEMSGGAFDELRRTVPSLAFLGEWPDEKLGQLLENAQPDEVTVLARVRPDLKDRLLKLSPPMTAEVVTEELAGKDVMKGEDKNRHLAAFTQRLKDRVAKRELDLEELFPAPAAGATSSTAAPLSAVPGNSGDASGQKAA